MKLNQRLDYIDHLKGITILLMIMGHVLAWSYAEQTFLNAPVRTLINNELLSSIIYRLIYSFHMPLLFFISGILLAKQNEWTFKSTIEGIKKKVFRILIPYLITGWALYFFKNVFGYWFLGAIFWIYLCFYIAMFLLNKLGSKDWLSCIVLLALCLPFSYLSNKLPISINSSLYINLGGSNSLPFVLGYVFKKMRFDTKMNRDSIIFLLPIIYIMTFLIYLYYPSEYPLVLMVQKASVYTPIILFLFFLAINKATKTFIGRLFFDFVAFLGEKSMQFYIVHLYFVMSFNCVGDFILSIDNIATSITFQILYSIIISGASILLSSSVIWVIEENKIARSLIFGLK